MDLVFGDKDLSCNIYSLVFNVRVLVIWTMGLGLGLRIGQGLGFMLWIGLGLGFRVFLGFRFWV